MTKKQKSNNSKIFWAGMVIAGLLAVFYYFGNIGKTPDESILSFNFYDRLGNPITPVLSVVSGLEGIYSMETVVNIKNTGDSPIVLSIDTSNSLPSEWVKGFTDLCDKTLLKLGVAQQCKPAMSVTLQPNQETQWVSALVKTETFEGENTIRFIIEVDATYTVSGETKTISKVVSKDIQISPDPNIDFNVGLEIVGDKTGGQACAQVVTQACNPATLQIVSYSTPCDVPAGWTTDLSQCTASTKKCTEVDPYSGDLGCNTLLTENDCLTLGEGLCAWN